MNDPFGDHVKSILLFACDDLGDMHSKKIKWTSRFLAFLFKICVSMLI